MHGTVVSIFAVSGLIHFIVEESYFWRIFSPKTSEKEKKELKKDFPLVSFITL
jgi:hypothetical protein